jgi:sulfoxide reductase heme-binding subunit YedZ
VPTLGTASQITGLISLVLLTAVVMLGILVNRQGRLPGLSAFAGLSLHRFTSLLAVGFLALHILTAVAEPLAGVGLAAAIIPFVAADKPFWLGLGTVSFDLMAALIVTSLLRRHIGRRCWRAVHWLAYACWPAALAHSIGSNPDMRSGRLLDLAAACIVAVLAAAGWRLAGPVRARPRARLGPVPAAPEPEPAADPAPAADPGPAVPEPMVAPDPMAAAAELTAAPEPAAARNPARQLRVNPIACTGHGLCAELLPELVTLDEWGYPLLAGGPVPAQLTRRARHAVTNCPALALLLVSDGTGRLAARGQRRGQP